MIGASVVGLGVGEQHARAFARMDGCRLRFVHDLDSTKARSLATELGCLDAQSFDRILADEETDVVSIATFDDAHPEQVIAALEHGKHVFCEKPLCRNHDELERIHDAWRKSQRRLACNLILRAAPLWRWVRQAIRDGELGTIYAFDGDYLYGRVEKITQGWRKNVDDYSVVAGGGVHLIDLLIHLTGEKPEILHAMSNKIATKDTPFRYDDFAAIQLGFASGLVGRITANFGCVHRHQHVVRIFGTKATLLSDDAGVRIHRTRDPLAGAQTLSYSPVPSTKGDLIASFVESIVGSDDSMTAHELDVMSVTLAADDALRTRKPQRIEYLT